VPYCGAGRAFSGSCSRDMELMVVGSGGELDYGVSIVSEVFWGVERRSLRVGK